MADDLLPLVERLASAAERRGYRLAAAESCTGGGLSSAITDLAGVSSVFLGGVVSYANEVKEHVLGVPADVLRQHGAVSEPTARAMAEGVCRVIGAEVGFGITGVAGPGGGSAEKPVGLVYIAVATPRGTRVRRDVWPGDRAQIRRSSIDAALRLAIEAILDEDQDDRH
jgi:PncC family amidohydrolase